MALVNFTGPEAQIIDSAVAAHYLASIPTDQLKPNEQNERAVRNAGRNKLNLAGGAVDLTQAEALELFKACAGYYLYDKYEGLTQQELSRQQTLWAAMAKLQPIAIPPL